MEILFCKKDDGQNNPGDILVSSDVGNIFNSKGESRIIEYTEMTNTNKTGIVAFSQNGNTERLWTKGDLFKHFKVYDDPHFTDTVQIWVSAFILRKTPNYIELVNRWFDTDMNHYDLATYKKLSISNLKGFRERRHDQSVFSLLVGSYNSTLINSKEVYADEGGWEVMSDFPIWRCRKKDFKQNKLLKKILTPYKWITREYPTVFENMDINKEFKW